MVGILLVKGKCTYRCSIQPEDWWNVHTYLNSQPRVRFKYANKKTVDVDTTMARVKTLADRFNTEAIPTLLQNA